MFDESDEDPRDARLAALLASTTSATRLRPVADDPDEHRRWIDRDLVSMVEGCHGVVLDPRALTADARDVWLARLAPSWAPPPVDPAASFTRRWWIVDRNLEVGTLATASSVMGRHLLPLYSLYVEPTRRASGAAGRALELAQSVAVAEGLRGIQLDAEWTWQHAVRYYLRRGFWVRMWKRALTLQRGPQLPRHAITVRGDAARLVVVRDGREVELLRAWREGARLGWAATPAWEAARRGDDFALAIESESTFALALALAGYPLVRSDEAWARGMRETDVGGPESLARKIELFEALARRDGHVIRTPRIPGLAYRDLDALE